MMAYMKYDNDFSMTWLGSKSSECSVIFASCGAFLLLYFLCIDYFKRKGCAPFVGKTVLFVTAHPDDECMFFAPCIQHLSRLSSVHLLCLSEGNYYGQGDIRRRELQRSCGILGIWPANVSIIAHSALPDNPTVEWDHKIAGELIHHHITKNNIDAVITFDQLGVSGHRNHVAIFNTMGKLMEEGRLACLGRSISVYVLKSVNLLRKYISVLDIIFSVFSRYLFMSNYQDLYTAWRAMAAHESQLVWFRKLYILFSRYMLINTLEALQKQQ